MKLERNVQAVVKGNVVLTSLRINFNNAPRLVTLRELCLALLSCVILYGVHSEETTQTSTNKDSIYIAGFFPTSNRFMNISPDGAIGIGVLPAVKLALYHINNDNNILPEHKLHITWNDTKCSASDGMKVFFDMMNKHPKKYVLFGDACTQVTEPIAKASRYWKVTQISYGDSHPMFNKMNYPNLFRIVPSEHVFNAAILAVLKMFKWTRLGTIYLNKPRYSLAHNKLLNDLDNYGIEITSVQSITTDITFRMQKLKERDVRIIIGLFNETWARKTFCEAYRERMYGRKYQWIIVAMYTPSWWRKRGDVNCTIEEIETALKGAILMDLSILSTSSDITISGLTAEKYNDMYQMIKLSKYSRFHGYAYDGIWAIALALHNMSNFYPDPTHKNRKDLLKTFEYHDDKWQTAFLKALEATDFTGVTGKINFQDNGRKGTILIKQFRAFGTVTANVKIGEFDGVTQTLTMLSSHDNGIQWNGLNPPSDRSIRIIESVHVNRELFVTMTTLSSVGIMFAFVCLAINIWHRNQRNTALPISSLNNLIIMGCILLYASVIILGLDSGSSSVTAFPYICTTRASILIVGFSLVFGSMISKAWRVHSISTEDKSKDIQLFLFIGFLIALDFVIMFSWQFTYPMYRATSSLVPYPSPKNDDILVIPEVEYCQSEYMNYFVWSIYIYKGLLMLFASFLTWKTRHISVAALNESKYIWINVINCLIFGVLGASLSYLLPDRHDASFLIISIFTIVCTTVTLCLVFLPKTIELRKNPKRIVVIKPLSQTRRVTGISINEAELRSVELENQKIQKRICEVQEEIKVLEEILGDDAQDLLHDTTKSEVLNKSGNCEYFV